MDFQYLPMERNALGNYESVYDSLLPNTIVPPCWLSEPCSSLLLPPVFSRTDSIQVVIFTGNSSKIYINMFSYNELQYYFLVLLISF